MATNSDMHTPATSVPKQSLSRVRGATAKTKSNRRIWVIQRIFLWKVSNVRSRTYREFFFSLKLRVGSAARNNRQHRTNHAMQNFLLRDSVIILTKRHCSVIQSEKKRVVYCSMLADRRSPKRLYCVFSVQLTEFSRTNAQP